MLLVETPDKHGLSLCAQVVYGRQYSACGAPSLP